MISQYIKAGFMPQMGCNLKSALEYVEWEKARAARYNSDSSAIEVEVQVTEAEWQWLESGYWWENNHLLCKQ